MAYDEIVKAIEDTLAKFFSGSDGDPPWPDPPDPPPKLPAGKEGDFEIARYNARLEDVKARRRDPVTAAVEALKIQRAREDASTAAEDTLRAAVQAAYLEVGKGTLDRSFKRAEAVTGAAAAVGTTYGALLALAFSVSADTPQPLPARGLAPAVFLAGSLLLGAIYIAFVRRHSVAVRYLPSSTDPNVQEARLIDFLVWVNSGALRRAWALRTAVVSLGVGIALIPLPFLALSSTWVWVAIGLAGATVLVWLLIEVGYWAWTRNYERPAGKGPGPLAGA